LQPRRKLVQRLGSVSVTAESGGLKVNSPYNAEFVALLKTQIPSTGRKWEPNKNAGTSSPQYSADLKLLIDQCYGGDVQMPTVIAAAAETFEISFQADYVANCKNDAAIRSLQRRLEREDPGESSTCLVQAGRRIGSGNSLRSLGHRSESLMPSDQESI
jgi:hypothetical protein